MCYKLAEIQSGNTFGIGFKRLTSIDIFKMINSKTFSPLCGDYLSINILPRYII